MKILSNNNPNFNIKKTNIVFTQVIRSNLQYHDSNINKFNKKMINDLLYDEKKHIVSIFKEYLILDDIVEYLQRYFKFKKILFYFRIQTKIKKYRIRN